MDIDQEWRRARLKDAVIRFGTKAALGRAMGLTSGAYIRQMCDGERAITEKTVAGIEALPGMHDWFARTSLMVSEVGHSVSLPVRTVTPPLPWEALTKMRHLPARFSVVLPDNAMAPEAQAGDEVEFERGSSTARPGSLVLIADNESRHYVRELALLLDEQQVGRASNPAFPDVPLSGERRVIAVMCAIKYGGGWDAVKARRKR